MLSLHEKAVLVHMTPLKRAVVQYDHIKHQVLGCLRRLGSTFTAVKGLPMACSGFCVASLGGLAAWEVEATSTKAPCWLYAWVNRRAERLRIAQCVIEWWPG